MGEGVISRFGYAEIDDSKSMLFDGEGFVAGRPAGGRAGGRACPKKTKGQLTLYCS